jgi:hypothetical protein
LSTSSVATVYLLLQFLTLWTDLDAQLNGMKIVGCLLQINIIIKTGTDFPSGNYTSVQAQQPVQQFVINLPLKT